MNKKENNKKRDYVIRREYNNEFSCYELIEKIVRAHLENETR